MSGNFVDRLVKSGQHPGAAAAPPSPSPGPVQEPGAADNVIPLQVVEETKSHPTAGSDKQPYTAFGEHKVKKRYGAKLRLLYGKNAMGQYPIGSMNYSYLTEIVAHSNRFLAIIFTNVVITLEGDNLLKLYDSLEDDRVHWLQCFDTQRHAPPSAGELVITSIKRESLAEFMRGSK